MLAFRRSRAGFALAGVFLSLAAATHGWLLYSGRTNPADSGEGGVLLLLFTLPWPSLLPESVWNAPAASAYLPALAWVMIGCNAFLLYCLGGGLRWRARRS